MKAFIENTVIHEMGSAVLKINWEQTSLGSIWKVKGQGGSPTIDKISPVYLASSFNNVSSNLLLNSLQTFADGRRSLKWTGLKFL